MEDEKIKANLNRENTQEGEVNWVLIFFFKHNKFKQKKHKYKEIRLEKTNLDFIVVQHPLPTSTLLKLLIE